MKEKEIENLQIELDQANELIVELKQELAELKKPPAGIEECLLSDEEIKTIEGRVFRECQPAGYDFEFKVQKAVAQAQLDKCAAYINQKVEQKVKEERERVLNEMADVVFGCDDLQTMERAITEYLEDEQAKLKKEE